MPDASLDPPPGGRFAGAERHFPVRVDWEDTDVVRSRLQAVRAASLLIHQRVSRDAVVLADASVTAALVSRSGRPQRQPAAWLAIHWRLAGQGEI